MYSKIVDILPVPQTEIINTDEDMWSDIQKMLCIEFPDDYKEFINIYGFGSINKFLWVLSPFSENENLSYLKKFNDMKFAYQYMQKEFPLKYFMKYFDHENGLLPWGITDNGDELYWYIDNGKRSIVVMEARYAEIYKYDMELTEFIYKLLNKEIQCNAFPDDFFEENYYYETY